MATFKDAIGREWHVSLDGPKIRAVREKFKEIKFDPIAGDAYDKVYGDDLLLIDVLAALCRTQIEERKLSVDDFASQIYGDAITAALAAFHQSQMDFSPSSRRELLRAAAAKTEKVREAAMSKAMDWLASPELDREIEAALDNAKRQALTQLSSATSLPESSASPPKDEPSAN